MSTHPSVPRDTVDHYDVFFDQDHVSPGRTVMTPGNHTNGPGGKYPDVQAWLNYNERAAPDDHRRRLDRRSNGIP